MDSASVTCSTPARFKLCGSPPALHIAPEQSGAWFGEHHRLGFVRQSDPLPRCRNGPGTQTPARFCFWVPRRVITVHAPAAPTRTRPIVSPRLEPQEALAGPLYAVATALMVIPLVDFIMSVPRVEFSDVQWRFAAVGLLSGYTLTPMLGLALAIGVSSATQRDGLQRVLAVVCLTSALFLMIVCLGFALDVVQLRASVPAEGRETFANAWQRAMLKHGVSALVFAYLGWRALRVIPAPSRHRGPKPVHVVTK